MGMVGEDNVTCETPLLNVGDCIIMRGFRALTTIIRLFCLPDSHTALHGVAAVGILSPLSLFFR